jgi:hypothetical protein
VNSMEYRVMVWEVLVSKDLISMVYRKILAEMLNNLLLLLSVEKFFLWFVLFLFECSMFLQ